MLQKSLLQNIISKYYLGMNESVKWDIKENILNIKFQAQSSDLIGNITVNDFPLEDYELPVYDTKKLINLINICSEDLNLEIESHPKSKLPSKMRIDDGSFECTYTLSDSMLLPKIGQVNEPQWDVEILLSSEDITNMIKAKSALSDIDTMVVEGSSDFNNNKFCDFIFGDDSDYNNKIKYTVKASMGDIIIRIPFNSEYFKLILAANKDSHNAIVLLNGNGLMKMEFKTDTTTSTYYIIRKPDVNL